MRAGLTSVGPRSSGEVARQHAGARSNQRFVNSFLCMNLFFAERHSYVHICGFNAPVQRRRAAPSAATGVRHVHRSSLTTSEHRGPALHPRRNFDGHSNKPMRSASQIVRPVACPCPQDQFPTPNEEDYPFLRFTFADAPALPSRV